MEEPYEIALATEHDLDAVLDLQERNLPKRGGTLSACLSRGWFETAMAAMPVVVARRAGRLVGYLVSAPVAAFTEVAVVQAMLEAYRGASDAYIYGPICVDEIERGQGVANAMFASLRAQLPGREGVLFIRCDNAASLRAHARMGMREVAEFDHNGTQFVVLSYVG
ncbi:N-acetyltransferase family protein [Mesorhizobium sp. LjNodule214]|uniref:GNAT family N-acetyltransferase n=1 Tax=Mesorhizobium sp. LjNodule214 TaxID=3342252 RepID=UPI003ECD31D8